MSALPGIRAAAHSDVGRRREVNEDRYVCEPKDGIFSVIDGMGGYAGGDVAAEEARQALLERLRHRTGTPAVRLREAVVLANNRIFRRASEDIKHAEMACVLTAVIIDRNRLHAAHVGDTRLYKIKDGAIRKLTRDHSIVGVQEDTGQLSELAAMRHPRRNEVLRDVGSMPHQSDDVEFIESLELPFEPDCALLLCTDGLTDLVMERELLDAVVTHAGDPDAAARHLVEQANEKGGTDNITVVIIEGAGFSGEDAAAVSTNGTTHNHWSYFWAGIATMLLIGLLVFGIRDAMHPPETATSVGTPLLQLRQWTHADGLPPDSGSATLTPVVALRDTVAVLASPWGVRLLAFNDSLAVADSLPMLRGFILAPDSSAPGVYAVGFFVAGEGNAWFRLIVTPDSLATALTDPH